MEKLHRIDEQLTQCEVGWLKFLCLDLIGRKRLESVKDAKDLFIRFTEQDLLTNELFLPDLLCTIGRLDLLSILDTNEKNVRRLLENQDSGVSEYRKMLFLLSEDVTDENLHDIKFLLRLPKAKLDNATFLDLLAEMEKMEKLGENNLDELEDILSKTSRELAGKVRNFKSKRQRVLSTGEKESTPVQEQSIPVQHENSVHVQDEEFLRRLSTSETNISLSTDASGLTPANDDYYPMDARPLGYCVIINNFNFELSSNLRNRNGTNVDRDKLQEVFEKMHFTVKTKEDQKCSDLMNIMVDFSSMDHSEMDAFVCCILSHGRKGSVLGIDGNPVQIRDITKLFAKCPTLVGKPKIFFIQACQGSSQYEADGLEQDEFMNDADSVSLEGIPIESDFLLGMATVESYMSFRHITNGSIYIQELCKQLLDGCHRNEDILSILTKVNRNVSKRVLNHSKQMPEPRYTLTKKLVLPID